MRCQDDSRCHFYRSTQKAGDFMNDDCIAKIWKYAITGFVCVLFLITGSCQAGKYQTRKAIEAGASPLAARCALAADGAQRECGLLYAAEAEQTRP